MIDNKFILMNNIGILSLANFVVESVDLVSVYNNTNLVIENLVASENYLGPIFRRGLIDTVAISINLF
jgi:hypothetical protein